METAKIGDDPSIECWRQNALPLEIGMTEQEGMYVEKYIISLGDVMLLCARKGG